MTGGESYFFRDAVLSEKPQGKKGKLDNIPEEVTSPMPAVVSSVLVKEGESVSVGQPVITVSAMKMETTLSAPYSGIVKKINVKEQDKVMPGEILIEIESG